MAETLLIPGIGLVEIEAGEALLIPGVGIVGIEASGPAPLLVTAAEVTATGQSILTSCVASVSPASVTAEGQLVGENCTIAVTATDATATGSIVDGTVIQYYDEAEATATGQIVNFVLTDNRWLTVEAAEVTVAGSSVVFSLSGDNGGIAWILGAPLGLGFWPQISGNLFPVWFDGERMTAAWIDGVQIAAIHYNNERLWP